MTEKKQSVIMFLHLCKVRSLVTHALRVTPQVETIVLIAGTQKVKVYKRFFDMCVSLSKNVKTFDPKNKNVFIQLT
jgi:hypothetical protein